MSDEPVNDNVTHVDFTRGRTRTKTETPAAKVEALAVGDGGTKLLVFRAMIAEGMVMIRFATQAPHLIVPEALKSRPVNALNFSTKFGIADFVYDGKGVRATLSFGGVNAYVDVPWPAVFGMVSHKTEETVAWPDSMPVIAKEPA